MNHLQAHQKIHIIGIGGAGMSAIARVLRGRGFQVQGTDRRASPLTADLQAEGIAITIGQAAENLGAADLVLASSAVPEDNVEVLAARERNIPVMRRPDFLGELTEGYDLIAIAGAHGKTTVTGMTTLALLEAGLDPTFIIGGVVAGLGTNARVGAGKHFIIEADEYRSTFLALKPQVAVITNIEYDHPDSFKSLRYLRLAFGDFVDNIRPDGTLIACNDDKIAHAVGASFHANGGHLLLYGIHAGVGLAWQAAGLHPNEFGGLTFLAIHDEVPMGQIRLRVPGAFNVLNALATLTVTSALGLDWVYTRLALEKFEGTARRFEVLGDVSGVVVVDDYAHHPTQIAAVIAAATQRYPDRRIVVAWEPHTFSRIRALHSDFMKAFAEADEVIVLPIYAAREKDDGTLTAQQLAAEIIHPEVTATTSQDEAVQVLLAHARPGDVVLLLGAGDEYVIGQRLLEQLQTRNIA
ncbi:MAG TPA: UDP-N-acetylmuramate--L-alanine ligase [Anaerolineae bacterium]|nr:UDP-N-acetylmuramate--L-alanine ligase [Anaerolineae bacterium]